MLVGIVLIVSTVVVAVGALAAHGARIRRYDLLTGRDLSATTGRPSSEFGPGGRPGGRDSIMAVVADDVRAGVMDAARHETGPAVAFATGVLLIGAGVALQDSLPFRGATIMAIGGTFMALALFVPYTVRKMTERLQPDLTEELAEIEDAWHAGLVERDRRFAEQLADLRGVVVGIRGQLR
jgi:hypothetical protein